MDEDLTHAERVMFARAGSELEALGVAQRATTILASAIEGAVVGPASDRAPPEWYVSAALLPLAIAALRSGRAAILLLAVGYEPESHGHLRRLMEIFATVKAIANDPSGQYARQWLDGRPPGTPRKVVGRFASLEHFDMYSSSEHADIRSIRAWLGAKQPEVHPDHMGLHGPPSRNAGRTNEWLVEVAWQAAAIAGAMATVRDMEIADLNALDAEIDEMVKRWYPGGAPKDESNQREEGDPD